MRVRVWDSRLAEAWETEESPFLEALRKNAKSSCEIGASQRGPEPWNLEVEESTVLGAVAKRQPVKT
jgi:hypothetical protein